VKSLRTVLALFAAIIFIIPVFAQNPPPNQAPPPGYPQGQQAPPPYPDNAPPPSFTPDQLDNLVSRVALYPDSLLAQVLAAATYPDQIPDAARWADQHHYLQGQELANAIQADQLPWDPSVQALLPFPSVLGTMASDMRWTSDLGNAFLANQQDVMDAVQRERHKAESYGYLRTNGQVVVTGGPYVAITPVNPDFIVVPYYDPRVVFFAPRPGFVVGGGIRFGFGVTIGGFFRPWGWGYDRFDWGHHAVFINNSPWRRTWVTRRTYVHPYPEVRRFAPGPRPAEHHETIGRSEVERRDEREGRAAPREEHHDDHRGGGHDGGHDDHHH
jgi:hypothetical protein